MLFKVDLQVRETTDGVVKSVSESLPLEELDAGVELRWKDGGIVLSRGGVNNKTLAVRLADQSPSTARVLELSEESRPEDPDGGCTEWMDLGPVQVRLFIDQVADPSRNLGRHHKKICVNCWHFSREEGQRILKETTHHFADGSYSFPAVVADVLAERAKSRPLTLGNVGYCARGRFGKTLLHSRSPACENYDPVPWLHRVFNRLKMLLFSS